MLGLRAKLGFKALTTFPLYQRQISFKKDVQTKPKKLPCCLHRRVPSWGIKRPVANFDIKNVVVYSGLPCHKGAIVDFLMRHYWPREPITTGLYMSLKSCYLKDLTCHFAESGDRYLAIEHTARGPILVGVCIAERIIPKRISDLFNYGQRSCFTLEGVRLLFLADCLRKADTFDTYNVNCIYHVEVLATDPSIPGRGVGSLLLETVLSNAIIAGYPLMQVLATNDYAARICKRLKMKSEMSMPYSLYKDVIERPIFFPRGPHSLATLYTRQCADRPPKLKSEPRLFKTFSDLRARYEIHPYQD